MDTLKKRRFDFIKDETFKLLSKTQRKKLDEYREQYRLCVLKEKKINTLKKQIKEQQDLLRLMKRDLTELSKPLEILKNDFQFFVSITSYKNKGNRYYNLCISRVIKGNPRNVSLGREEKIKEHLLEYFKGNRKKVSEIKKDWKTFLKNECGIYETYDKIMKIIHTHMKKGSWGDLKIYCNDLFPL